MSNHLHDGLIGPQAGNQSPFLALNEPGATGHEISFAQLAKLSSQYANMLAARNVRPGDRVAARAFKRPEILALYLASVQIGAVFLPLNTGYRQDEVAYFLEDASPRLFLCEDRLARDLQPVARRNGTSLLTMNADGTGGLAGAVAGMSVRFEPVARRPGDLAALLYTSGTTGRPKGAMLTHDNLLSNTRCLVRLWQMSSRDVLIHALPIYHTHGLFVAVNTALMAGARVDFMAGFDLDAIIAALPGSTMMMGVPTFYVRLLGDLRLDRRLTTGMRLFISGSAPLLAETQDVFADRTGHRILERYGMTETGMITSNPVDGSGQAGIVGTPLDGVELRIVTEGRQAVLAGEIGQIEVRGPNVCRGYWGNAEKTSEAIRKDGFFATGDLGRLDEHGYLEIVGRQKDLIITGGLNVYPKEVEDVLNAVDGVAESAVIGIPDPEYGEQVVAVLAAAPDKTLDTGLLGHEIAGRLARFKHPRRIEVIDELPRNSMGKVEKNALRQRYADPDC